MWLLILRTFRLRECNSVKLLYSIFEHIRILQTSRENENQRLLLKETVWKEWWEVGRVREIERESQRVRESHRESERESQRINKDFIDRQKGRDVITEVKKLSQWSWFSFYVHFQCCHGLGRSAESSYFLHCSQGGVLNREGTSA